MKTIFLVTIIALGLPLATVQARTLALRSLSETLAIRAGQQKTAKHAKITVKFISVVEDSRCPVGTNCIWAGNAKIKITVAKGSKAAKTFELNSTLVPQSVTFDGFDIKFIDLTPRPGEEIKAVVKPAVVMISVAKAKH